MLPTDQKNPVNYAPYRYLRTASCFDTQERSLIDQITVKKKNYCKGKAAVMKEKKSAFLRGQKPQYQKISFKNSIHT